MRVWYRSFPYFECRNHRNWTICRLPFLLFLWFISIESFALGDIFIQTSWSPFPHRTLSPLGSKTCLKFQKETKWLDDKFLPSRRWRAIDPWRSGWEILDNPFWKEKIGMNEISISAVLLAWVTSRDLVITLSFGLVEITLHIPSLWLFFRSGSSHSISQESVCPSIYITRFI